MKFFRDLSQTFTSFIYHSVAESRSSCITCGDSFIGRESIFGSCEDWILKLLQAVRLTTQRTTDSFLRLDFDDEPETWICSVQFGRITDTRLTSTTRDRMTSSVNSGQQSHSVCNATPRKYLKCLLRPCESWSLRRMDTFILAVRIQM